MLLILSEWNQVLRNILVECSLLRAIITTQNMLVLQILLFIDISRIPEQFSSINKFTINGNLCCINSI